LAIHTTIFKNIVYIPETEMNGASVEQQLLEGCIRGNADCQRMLFNRFYAKMLSLCKRYAANEDEAKDLLQEGFIKVFDNLGKYRGESSLQTWVSRIMINNAINQYNKAKKISWVTLEPSDEFDLAESEEEAASAIDTLDADEVMALIQKLPTGYRTILNLYAVEGYTHKQISEILGIAEGTSKSQLSKARILLKQELIKNKPNAQRG
jgi:RNA polymerase sigma factor (sigma-70 family)